MAKFGFTFDFINKVDKTIEKQVQSLNKASVRIGFLDGQSSPYPDGKSVATVAAQNEFGAIGVDTTSLMEKAKKAGLENLVPKTFDIPSRPFFRTAMDNNQQKYGKMIEKFFGGNFVYSEDKLKKFLSTLGIKAKQDIQSSIVNGNWQPNSLLIQRLKGLAYTPEEIAKVSKRVERAKKRKEKVEEAKKNRVEKEQKDRTEKKKERSAPKEKKDEEKENKKRSRPMTADASEIKPLIWDGHMLQSVTYIVDTGT
jgi:hypothetical protein